MFLFTVYFTGPYQIEIATTGNDFLLLPLTKIHGSFKVERIVNGGTVNLQHERDAEAAPPLVPDDVTTINYMANTLFNQAQVK